MRLTSEKTVNPICVCNIRMYQSAGGPTCIVHVHPFGMVNGMTTDEMSEGGFPTRDGEA
jgi:hypothetical protein